MRSLFPDHAYYRFLDNMREGAASGVQLASTLLVAEFPTLRGEEARAVYCDWRASRTQLPERHP
ncbi:MAG TPA: hypothetical protein DCP91_07300 [Eggerthellaceae bacterium]|nr:hypothetical protein [Eggerthellaceae bacterium]